MSSPMPWMVAIIALLSGVICCQAILLHRMNRMWTRSFLDKQGIPQHIMEGEPEAVPEPRPATARPKTKISIPVPGWRPGVPHS